MLLPTIKESRKFLIDNLRPEGVKLIRTELTKNLPDKMKRMYWPKGYRFSKLNRSQFKKGLLASIEDGAIPNSLVLQVMSPLQFSPIQTAFTWWESNSLNGLGEAAFRWLAVRFQPIAETLIWYEIEILERDNIEYKDLLRTEDDCNVVYLEDKNFTCTNILKHISENLIETALEFMIPYKNINHEILHKIHEKKYADAATDLRGSSNYQALSTASICLFAAKEFGESIAIISESNFPNIALKKSHIFALKALIALETSNGDECLSAIREARHADTEKLLNWPTWSLLEGLAYHNSNQLDKAALAFLSNGGGERGYSLLPVQLALATLEIGGFDLPDILIQLLQQKYATSSNRLQAEKELQALYGKLQEYIPTPPPPKSKKKLSDQKNPIPKEIPPIPQSFNNVQDILWKQFHIEQQVQQNVDDRNFEQLANNSQKLNEFVQKQKELFICLVRDTMALNPNAELPSPQKDDLDSEKSLKNYLSKLKKHIENARLESERKLEQRKNDFIKKLTLNGIAVPVKIKNLTLVSELDKLEQEFEEKIEIEEIFQKCINNNTLVPNITKLLPAQRLDIFQRLADTENNPRLKNELFESAIHHNDLLRNFQSKGIDLLLKLTKDCVSDRRALPPGIWKTLKQLNGGKLSILFEERNFFSHLVLTDIINISEFFSEYDGDVEKLPNNLKLEMKILALELKELSNRIPELTSLFLKYPKETKITASLLTALLENEQYEESLCLASLGSSMGWLQINDDSLRDLIVMIMLVRSEGDNKEQKKAIIEILLSDLSWVTSRLCDIAALLYILATYNLSDIYVNLMYQYPKEIKEVQHSYPELIGYLIEVLESKNSLSSHKFAKESLTCKGTLALRSFKHDLKKKSCYQSWEPATKYQRYFNKVLCNCLNQIQKSNKFTTLKAIHLIEEAQKDGNLSKPDTKRQLIMKQYIVKQMQRLQIVSDSLSEVKFDVLDKNQSNYCELIEKERCLSIDNNIMKIIYHNIFEG